MDHWAHPGYFETWIPLKPALGCCVCVWGGGGGGGVGRMQPGKLQYCIWRDSIKPSPIFVIFSVFIVSKGSPFDFYWKCSAQIPISLRNSTVWSKYSLHAFRKAKDAENEDSNWTVRIHCLIVIFVWHSQGTFLQVAAKNATMKVSRH